MRLLFLILSTLTLTAAGTCQQVSRVNTDSTGNTSAIYIPGFDAENHLHQSGSNNLFFIYSPQDRANGFIRVAQAGRSNKIFSVAGQPSGLVFQVLTQKGSENRIELYQAAKRDSLAHDRREIKVVQDGTGNSVTIIQRNK